MGLVITTFFSLCLWIALWAIGAKAFDAFMVSTLIIVIGAAVRIALPQLPGNRSDS